MGPDQHRLLNKMKYLIKQGKCRIQERPDRDLFKNLNELSITIKDVWNHILTLNQFFYHIDGKEYYKQSINTLTFIKQINNIEVYIKLKLEIDTKNEEEVVVISFHKSYRRN